MDDTDPKTTLYEAFARVGRAALGNPARIELLNLLAQGERGVEDLAAATGLKLSNTSAQLKVLANAGLVSSRRNGTSVRYRIADSQVTGLVEFAKRLAIGALPEARDAARSWLGETGALEPVTRAELARRMRDGGVLVLDVRPEPEFAAGHIAGAVNVPLADLPGRLAEVPREGQVVAYCRGQFCAMSPEAVRLLRREGYRARVLDGGLPEWRADGLPLAVG
jgi:rhodanese-related sulfurtransferase